MFDVEGARKAGYSDAEIADHMAGKKFDVAGARKAGYSDADIVSHLLKAPSESKPANGVLERAWERGKQSPEAALLMGLGKGIGEVGLGAQHYLGKGLSAIGAETAGNWLVNDAAQGRQRLSGELADYKAREPVAAGIGEVAGNVAATAPVGGLLAMPLRGFAPKLASSIATSGMTTGAAPVGMAAKAGDMGLRMLGGGITGGVAAGLVDPEAAGTGAMIGAAAPPVIKGLGMAGKAIGNAAKPVAAAFSDKAAKSVALDKTRGAIGEKNIVNAVGDIQTYYPKGAENIPVSAAGITRSPDLAQLERASRLKRTGDWFEFDKKQADAVFENVTKATSEADDLAKRFSDSAENWATNWAKAEKGIKPRVFAKRMGELKGKIDQAAMSKESVNPDVMAALKQIDATVMRFGSDFSPGHLQQLRAEFNGKVKPLAQGTIKAAPRGNPLIKSIISEFDDILNKSTSGKWDKVSGGYAKDSAKIEASEAAQKVRNAIVNPKTGVATGGVIGDTPVITRHRLSQIMNGAKTQDGKNALSQEAISRLSATVDALDRQGFAQGVKLSGLTGGGSDTVSNALVSQAGETVSPSAVLNIIKAIKASGTAKTDAEIARLLQDPDALAKLLSAKTQKRGSQALSSLAYKSAPMMAISQ